MSVAALAAAEAASAGRQRLGELRREIDTVLGSHVRPGTRVALLGAPDYFNVGDSMLWVGARAWLRDHGVRCVYVAPFGRIDVHAARRAVGAQGQILFNAGGYLTDSWPDFLARFVDALDDLADIPVLVLPQSIHFRDRATAASLVGSVARHGQVTILVRDRASVRRCAEIGLTDIRLCPDLAFVNAGLDRGGEEPSVASEPLVLRRGDSEARGSAPGVVGVNDGEWVSPRLGRSTALWAVARTMWRVIARLTPRLAGDPRWGGRLVDAHARLAVRRGVALIGPAGLVVTDRLHASLLGYLRGREVVAVNSSTGKVHDVLSTWLPGDPRVILAGDWAEAEVLYGQVIASMRSSATRAHSAVSSSTTI